MKRTLFIVVSFLLFGGGRALAQQEVDDQVIARIKMEGFQDSHVMETLSTLTEVHGPRLTGSPAYTRAAEWARDQMTEWGMADARLEPWGKFGPGWSVQRFSVEMTAPRYNRLIAYPHAWTPSTSGVVRGVPVLVEISGKEDFEKYRGQLKGAIVLRGKPSESTPQFEPPAVRFDDSELESRQKKMKPGRPESLRKEAQYWQEQEEKDREILQFLKEEEIAVLLEPSVRSHNVISVAALGYFLGTEPFFPAFVVALEQYAQIVRLLGRNQEVTLEISLTTQFHTEDEQGYNVLADIPGTDPQLKDELVILGAHLDSWHSGTGAVDNGAGCAVVMEAVRILKSIQVQPRRTIRVALWGGEEQDYFGSEGYVKKHFGDPETLELKSQHSKVSGYFNLDNGSGRIRGIHLQGNELVRPIFEEYLEPFHYLEASTLTIQNTGGTDHMLFNAIGIPGFQFIQDPLDYHSTRHHSDLDLLEGALEDDLQQAAVIMASFVYHTAMRDEMLPRVPIDQPEKEGAKPEEEASVLADASQ